MPFNNLPQFNSFDDDDETPETKKQNNKKSKNPNSGEIRIDPKVAFSLDDTTFKNLFGVSKEEFFKNVTEEDLDEGIDEQEDDASDCEYEDMCYEKDSESDDDVAESECEDDDMDDEGEEDAKALKAPKYTSVPSAKHCFKDVYLSKEVQPATFNELCIKLGLQTDEKGYYNTHALDSLNIENSTNLKQISTYADVFAPSMTYEEDVSYKCFCFTVFPKVNSDYVCFNIVLYFDMDGNVNIYLPKNYNLIDLTTEEPYSFKDFVLDELSINDKNRLTQSLISMSGASPYEVEAECKKIMVDGTKKDYWFPLSRLGTVEFSPFCKTSDDGWFVYVGQLKLYENNEDVDEFLSDYDLTPSANGCLEFYVKNNHSVNNEDLKAYKESLKHVDFNAPIMNKFQLKVYDTFVYIIL